VADEKRNGRFTQHEIDRAPDEYLCEDGTSIPAHQDKIDDQRVGVRSTALLFGRATRKWLVAFDLLMLVFLVLSFQWAGLSLSSYVLLAGAAAHLFWQSLSVDLDQPLDCLAKFRASRWTGWILLFAIVIGRSWT